jgi:hypothetical protein
LPQPSHRSPFAAVAFDLEGTLIDSGVDLASGVNAVRVVVGLARLPVSGVVVLVGLGARNVVRGALAEENPEPTPFPTISTTRETGSGASPSSSRTAFTPEARSSRESISVPSRSKATASMRGSAPAGTLPSAAVGSIREFALRRIDDDPESN